MPLRCTLLLSVTTQPSDRVAASPHSGGWSESFYRLTDAPVSQQQMQRWASARAALMSGLASVTGWRQQVVTISGNRLLPGGASSGTLNVPGAWGTSLNAPQDSLMVYYTVANHPGTVRAKLAALPDSVVLQGEYQPDVVFKRDLTHYFTHIVRDQQFAAITRDLSVTTARVLSIQPGVPAAGQATITVSGAIVSEGEYLITHRVRDDSGQPVSGSWYVRTVVEATGTIGVYVVDGYQAGKVGVPNGLARVDRLIANVLTGGNPGRLSVRKIGRPTVGYRGRRSKRPKTPLLG